MATGSAFDHFSAYSTNHLVTLLTIAVASIAIPLFVRWIDSARLTRIVAVALALVLVLRDAIGIPMAIFIYGQPPLQALPLHLCGLALLMIAYVLVWRSYPVFEIAYFWGLAGGMQALATPNVPFDFPHLMFVIFFAGHGLTIMGVIFAMAVFCFRPVWGSLLKTIAVTLAYLLVMIPINAALDTNFLYLRHKPAQPSLLDLLGPWPWYILGMIVVGALICLAYYVPFAVYDWIRARRRGRTT